MKATTLIWILVTACAAGCFARTNPYLPGSSQATLWDAIQANCLV